MGRRRDGGLLGDIERLVATVAKYLGYYTTAVKLAQLLPVLAGFAIVVFSPTAWLSATLRSYAFGAMAIGSLAGIGSLSLFVRRDRDLRRLAMAMLALALAFGASLRLHLATIDVGFAERWTMFRPFQDFYLGSETGELAFNLLAAFWFAATVFAATVGLPLYLKWRQVAAQKVADEPSKAERAKQVRDAMGLLASEMAKLRREVAELETENRSLRAQLELREARIEALERTLAEEGPPTEDPSA